MAARKDLASIQRLLLSAAGLVVVVSLLSSGSAARPIDGQSTPSSPSAVSLAWHHVNTSAGHPSARNWFGMAYDAWDNYTVLYGGYDPNSGSFYSDTWKYVGGNWTQLSPLRHPSADSGLHLVYDPMLQGVLAFGGESPYGGTYYNDTWLFQAGNWTQLSPVRSPPARSQFAMAYDAADAEIVLFGGGQGNIVLSDTWTFNGTTWTQVTKAVHPSGRNFANMAYDPITSQVLLAGGVNYSKGAMNDTWAFSKGSWSKIHDPEIPGRVHTPITTLPGGNPFFFGGQSNWGLTLYSSSYQYYSGAWHALRCAHAPSPRSNGGLVYDAVDGYAMTFGGGIYGSMWDETWALR